MKKIIWSDEEVYDLLVKMDGGYLPNEEEKTMLAGRRGLYLSGTHITSLPESIGELKALESLNLSRTRIAALPESIGKLTAIESLNLWDTRIAALPESIGNLMAIESLSLWDTQIAALPESIGNLTALKRLNLRGTQISALPESIGKLTALESLDLSFTQIAALPESIGELKALESLRLSGTRITALPASIGKLTALESLDLSFNSELAALTESIGNLTALKTLILRRTRISALPESIGELTALKTLDLSVTRISALPESIRGLAALETLYLGGTPIAALPECIGELPNLRHLDLAGLKLDRIPESLGLKGLPFVDKEHFNDSDTGVNLHRVTLSKQDVSIFLESPSLIPSLYKEDKVTLRECKVIFLGDGDSGKSYTIRRIENDGKKEHYDTSMTPGVEISDWDVKGEDGLKIHFWDFGGQELLHSMHRCFLTDKTCYVVTVKSREMKADIRARYWLRNVTAFAPGSPIILYVNCWDNDDGKRAIDETRLRNDFPNIKAVVYCSAKEATKAEFNRKLVTVLVNTLKAEGLDRREVVRKWSEVAQDIREMNEVTPYITKEDYHKICEKRGIKDENASDLLSFLNIIGVCFSYHRTSERKELARYRLLRPVWLTNAVYAIIRDGMAFAQRGAVPKEGIEKILCEFSGKTEEEAMKTRSDPTARYKKNECRYILEVAEAHELCYRLPNETLFFPALLKKNTPPSALKPPKGYPDRAEYLFEYDYLPDSVVHKLMIRLLNKEFTFTYSWHRGFMLGLLGSYRAIVRMDDDDDRTLHVEMYTKNGKPASNLFPLLRSEIIEVNRTLNLSARESLAADGNVFAVTTLIDAYKSNTKSVHGDVLRKAYEPFELLNRFYNAPTINGLDVNDRGEVCITPYHYRKYRKGDKALRRALHESYGKCCGYCGIPIGYREMQVDHILATNFQKAGVKDKETRMYIAELKEHGFDLTKPDYIENYMPCCGECNREKSNKTFNVEKLRKCHETAMEHTHDVLWLMREYELKFKE